MWIVSQQFKELELLWLEAYFVLRHWLVWSWSLKNFGSTNNFLLSSTFLLARAAILTNSLSLGLILLSSLPRIAERHDSEDYR